MGAKFLFGDMAPNEVDQGIQLDGSGCLNGSKKVVEELLFVF
jgi:hypothetical protein